MRKKKGFTLLELIIVLAIMGILLGILIPTWSYYTQRARIKTQNSKAKVIFNAAQTIVTEMQMSERKPLNDFPNAGLSSDSSAKDKLLAQIYTHAPSSTPSVSYPNEWYFYYDGSTGRRVSATGGAINTSDKDLSGNAMGYDSDYIAAVNNSEWNDRLTRDIIKILDEPTTVFKIYVKDYKVQAVVSSRFVKDTYIGAYPTNLDKLDKLGVSVDDVRSRRVSTAVMTDFDLDTSEFTTTE